MPQQSGRAGARRSEGRQPSPSTRRSGQVKRREGEILDAAAQVFYEKGYADATMQEVADLLGLLKGSLYYYIKTKEDLLFWLLEEVQEDVTAIVDEVRALPDLSPLDRIEEYVRRQASYTLKRPVKISVYYREAAQLSDERRRHIEGERRKVRDFIARMIAEAQEREDVDAGLDRRVLANCVMAPLVFVNQWYAPGHGMSQADIAETCARFAVGGIVGRASLRT